jgi:MFS family permease
MQVTGPVINRVGSRATTIAGGILLSAAILLPIFSTSAITLGISLFMLGFAEGVIDVSQNTQAIAVERLYQRPIISTFHAWFSIGGAIGAGLGGLLLATGIGLNNLYVAGAIGLAFTVFAVFGLLPRGISERKPIENVDASAPNRASRLASIRLILILGALAFVLMLVEGIAGNWSTLQITEYLQVPDSLGALGYTFFAIAMTIGRFSADRVTAAIGPRRLVRYGALVAAGGLLVIILSGQLWLTFAGWALLGIGLSGCVPQIFTAAGAITTGKQGTNVARVVSLGYLGFLAGPAIIGLLSEFGSVTLAIILPGALCLVASLLAFALPVKSPVDGCTTPRADAETSLERS